MKTVVAAALGECVHVAGVLSFLRICEQAGWHTVFLGPALPPSEIVSQAIAQHADLVGVSYRLTPETGAGWLGEFAEAADQLRDAGVRFVFGGTPPVAKVAGGLGFFDSVFDGQQTPEEIRAFLNSSVDQTTVKPTYPQSTLDRIRWKHPYPLLRHHFGLPDLDATHDGIRKISESKVLDVLSLGIDQDAQENFFRPERQDARRTGAGGVPVREPEHYRMLFEASRCGNLPLMRTYSGCDDFIALARMYVDTINIAWPAIPLFWFNQMDGRGPLDLQDSIVEHRRLMAWYAQRGLPVEVNDPHHWSLRDAPDVIFVVSGYLGALNAKSTGVQDHIVQMMFNTPPSVSDSMDLAKMLATLDLVESLAGPDFRIWRQTRTGLLSYPLDSASARSHLATSVYVQMALRPHIVHVVAHCEAHHAATPDDVIESCKIAQRSIENALQGQPDMTCDPQVQDRRRQLVSEAQVLLGAIRKLGSSNHANSLTQPSVLARAVTMGLLDAPNLRNNRFARGAIRTITDPQGRCVAIDGERNFLTEEQRIRSLELTI